MMVSNRVIKIDLNKKTKNVVQLVQGDTNRKLTINVFDSDEPYLVDGVGGGTIHGAVYIEKPDGTTCGYDSLEDASPAVTGSGNTLTVYFVPQATTAHGWAYMTVSIFDDEGVELNTFGIDLYIDKKATAEISADYWNIKSIEGLTAAVEGLTQQMVRSVNHATADTNGNVTLLPWQIQYNGVVGGQQVGDVEEALDRLARMQAEIINQEIKDALVNALSHVAWADEHGQDYVDALEQAMRSKLVSISAVFSQGSAVIYNTDDLDTLRQYLTVTALYSDTTTRTVTAYTLSGTLTEGTSTITVGYGGKTTTFDVTVTALVPDDYQPVEYIQSTGTQAINLDGFIDITDDVSAELVVDVASFTSINSWKILMGSGSGTGKFLGVKQGLFRLGDDNKPFQNVSVTGKRTINISWIDLVATATIDGITVTTAYSDAYVKPFVLFASFEGDSLSYFIPMKLYSAKINGHEFVPVYRKSDTVIGLYDVQSGNFYTNAGTGTFTKGADISQ